jgi:hypothetical protein
MQPAIDKFSLHLVYVVDEEGMTIIFSDLKEKLVMQHHVTLIYFSPKNNFIFNRELEILQKRYPSQIILHQMREKFIDASISIQELLEAVINSNTKDNLLFILSHDDELIHIVSNRLWFLGICENQIQSIN